ncbi:hypothetical protein SUGI_0150030 [Cryptomeria japonica]|nr:hypothetical protein SUGI_0150030 [Cryptomeria japonica]
MDAEGNCYASGIITLRRKQLRRRRVVRPVRVVNEKVVGVDLGTLNSVVAATEGGNPMNDGIVFFCKRGR